MPFELGGLNLVLRAGKYHIVVFALFEIAI